MWFINNYININYISFWYNSCMFTYTYKASLITYVDDKIVIYDSEYRFYNY